MKNLTTIFLLLFSLHCLGQADSPLHRNNDTVKHIKKTLPADTAIKVNGAAIHPKAADSLAADSATLLAKNKSLTDSLKRDSAHRRLADSLRVIAAKPPGKDGIPRLANNKDDLFYILAGILAFMGAIKMAYPKYWQNTFRLIFQTSLRQKQTPEQIVQGYVPGFLLNLLFFMVGGVTIALFATQHVQAGFLTGPFWLLGLFCTGVLAGIYMIKYLVTLFAGWVFNAAGAAAMYSFVVFLINRFMGIILLPLLVVTAFYTGEIQTVMFTIAGSILTILLLYRYVLSLSVMRKNLKVSALHFFIYLCAVELMPLLVIFKVLFSQIPSNK